MRRLILRHSWQYTYKKPRQQAYHVKFRMENAYQHHTTAGGPPAVNGNPKVVVTYCIKSRCVKKSTVASKPEILNANENVDIHENSRLNSCLYPNFASSASSAVRNEPETDPRGRPIAFSSPEDVSE
jgi:hypothetical protein